MKEQKQEMKLPKLDDLFTSQAQRDYENAEKVETIDISKIKKMYNMISGRSYFRDKSRGTTHQSIKKRIKLEQR